MLANIIVGRHCFDYLVGDIFRMRGGETDPQKGIDRSDAAEELCEIDTFAFIFPQV